MDILILSWRGPKHPRAGGAEIVTFEHAKFWVKSGHKVVWFTAAFEGCDTEEIIEGIKIIRKGREVFEVHMQAFWWYFLGKHSKFDLVIDQFHGIPFFTPFYVRTNKLAFIHEVTKEVWKLNPWKRPFNLIPFILGNIFEEWIFKIIYKKVPFLTISQSTKTDLISWGINKSNITVIHSGIQENIIRKSPKRKVKTIIFLGALTEDKGLHNAIEAFATVNELKPKWQYWIVGKGSRSYLNRVKASIKNSRLEKNLKFWGYVSERVKLKLLSGAHLLINPSIREGWGLVNIEANSVGTPVVAFDVQGSRDSVRNNITGILCKKGDNKALAKTVIDLLDNPEKYNKLSKNALNWSKNFKWSNATKDSLKLIEKFKN